MDQATAVPPRLDAQPICQRSDRRKPWMPLHQVREVEAMTDELIEQVKTVLANASGGWLTDAEQDKIARAALAAINLPAQLEAARTQGWNEAIEAAAEAFEAEAETWLQLPARGSCSRLGAQAIRALSVPAIVEAGEHQPKENSDG